jgi:DNA-binding LytR/AlgR family response regulator
MRQQFTNPRVLGALVAVSSILGISGPFGTAEYMRIAPRVLYWAIIAVTTFAAGSAIAHWAFQPTHARNRVWVAVMVGALGTGAAASVIVLVVNWLAMGVSPTQPGYLISLIGNAVVVAAIISVFLYFFGPRQLVSDDKAETNAPSLLERLPIQKRGTLISMSVADHYVEVTTTKGQALLLLRLSDAIREVPQQDGLQVHRSHWVAQNQVVAARREKDRAILTMSDGRDIPVSRSYLPAVKDAGILPR